MATAAPALADGPGGNVEACEGGFQDVCVIATSPAVPGTPRDVPANGNAQGKAKPSKPSKPVCEAVRMEPQPPAGNPKWEGHTPGDGAVYTRSCIGGPDMASSIDIFWAAEAPEADAIDPAVVAQMAVDKMTLAPPDIAINPKPGGKGLVGMPVWMAVDQSPTTYGPNSATATAGGVTVTATAKVRSVVWNMGDGTSVTCTSPGTVYQKSFGMRLSPDCGHVYRKTSDSVGGTFKVTATATWAIDWRVTGGGGESGQLSEVRDSQAALTIIESQAVN
ncbi:ATP/GTP-binding protein [Streptomyces sp. NPDC014685]|uniref:ATP/GTP-binding protein n=1 Tax=Streptomyces sp. NPDC014685 TaxID=3364881 RepID=UPI0036F682A6